MGGQMKKQILLKIPENLKTRLQKEAKEKGLSLNSYITNLLWDVIEKKKRLKRENSEELGVN